ncbi:MAG TPA: hemerythrin domain-containing protein [Noviherbaspirillum sp.]|nr:hemerythrin domain-containing protein [Noviherbaspirillum sp.]
MDHIHAFEQSAELQGQSRFNIYAIIHKAIRLFMTDTLVAVGNMDCNDAAKKAKVLDQVRELAATCRSHFLHENEFIHPVMEARRPGSTTQVAAEHGHHAWAINRLEEMTAAVERAQGDARQDAANALYRYLALFVAENFVHMNVEETANNAVLWATHTDAELIGIEQAIVASQTPEEAMSVMRWMMQAMNAGERAEMLHGIRQHAPEPVFDAVLALAKNHLPSSEWGKLTKALAAPAREVAQAAA